MTRNLVLFGILVLMSGVGVAEATGIGGLEIPEGRTSIDEQCVIRDASTNEPIGCRVGTCGGVTDSLTVAGECRTRIPGGERSAFTRESDGLRTGGRIRLEPMCICELEEDVRQLLLREEDSGE